nr:hypothetical protein GCM10020092_094130 [Actinoplanes digitatis]
MESPPGLTVVAVEGDDILGSAKMGPNRPGRGAHVATGSFMVNPERHGRGVGRALGEYVIEWARREGYHSIQFNAVVESNAPAVHLWRALGFTIVGTVPEAFDHRTNGLVGLHIMVKKSYETPKTPPKRRLRIKKRPIASLSCLGRQAW